MQKIGEADKVRVVMGRLSISYRGPYAGTFRITFPPPARGLPVRFRHLRLVHIPKQEFPNITIRQGVVVGVYPGATSEEVEEQWP